MKFKIVILSFLFSNLLNAQDFFIYKISKPYCVLNFMQTAIGRQGTSSTLKKFIDDKTVNDADFKKLCQEFETLNLHYTINRDEFPENRNQNSSTYNLLAMNAVNAKDINDFKGKCIGLVPLNVNQKLYNVLVKAEKVYNRLIWNDFEKKTKNQLKALSKFSKFNSETFTTFSAFYQSSWTNDIPFQVAIYPIPGSKGTTTATPHINSLCVGVLTDETDYNSRNGVVLHEMCHIMFNEQSAEIQNTIDGFFNQNQSLYAKAAYSFFDEALATALGNGWTYQKITGKTDTSNWYNNPTIDGFAKALYPIIKTYLDENKTIDKEFIDTAVSLFAATFPQAIYDYTLSLNALVLYTDAIDSNLIRTALKQLFRVSSFDVSSPILHPFSIEMMNESKLTQFFVIHQNHNETLNKIKEIFPEINHYQFSNKAENVTFIDTKGRTVIVLLLNDLNELDLQLQKMKHTNFFDSKTIIQK